jgi:very-short-patch-repair endonuclease
MTVSTRTDDRPRPPAGADELAWLLYRQDGVIARSQVLRHMSEKALRVRLGTGRWRYAARGVYVTHNGPVTRRQRRWIAVLAVAGQDRSAVLAGPSALETHGLTGHRVDAMHVLLVAPGRDRDAPAGVVVHRTSRLVRADLHGVGSPPCTTPARSVVDAAQWASTDDQARVIVAAAFQQRRVGQAEVRAVLRRMPRARRRRLIREVAADAAGGSHSLPEAAFLRLLHRAGLPDPSRQIRRRDARGRVRYLDVYFEEWGLHIEIDGGQHMEVREWWSDMRRQNELWIPGDRVLRFPSWAIRHRPDEVVAQIRAALIAAGWLPDLGR